MKNLPATIDEHRDYLYEAVRLKLFFLHKFLEENPAEEFSFALRNRVDIFRKTSLNPEGLNPAGDYFATPGYLEFEEILFTLYKFYQHDREEFERIGFNFVRPYIDARVERDFYDRSALAGVCCGFLRVMRPTVPEKPGVSVFHMVNTRKPDSFLDDPEFMKESLLALCDLAESYGAVEVGTNSWLNQVPAWLHYFPDSFLANREAANTDVRWHYGFWGQFINARGCFNKKAGDFLRKNGKFPCYPSYAHCPVSDLREHLKHL